LRENDRGAEHGASPDLARAVVDGARRAGIEPAENRLVRDEECGKISGVSRSGRWRLERHGKFPPRRTIGDNSVGWLLSELFEWLGGRRDWPAGAMSPEQAAAACASTTPAQSAPPSAKARARTRRHACDSEPGGDAP
jgi:prophage regulatory protein